MSVDGKGKREDVAMMATCGSWPLRFHRFRHNVQEFVAYFLGWRYETRAGRQLRGAGGMGRHFNLCTKIPESDHGGRKISSGGDWPRKVLGLRSREAACI